MIELALTDFDKLKNTLDEIRVTNFSVKENDYNKIIVVANTWSCTEFWFTLDGVFICTDEDCD